MINTPMLFCRLCNNPNTDGWDECPICGTGNMVRPYTVTFTMQVPVDEFGVQEAIVLALANIKLSPDDFITQVSVEDRED